MRDAAAEAGGRRERVLEIDCAGARLVGLLHDGAPDATLALVVVVGGGQYRVGAHRQFVELARSLSRHGVPVLRFDVRGMGDSEGEPRHFLELDEDLRAAVDALAAELPALEGVVLWGLCDGASASILYAPRDPRVRAVALINPWISTDEGIARTYLKHYYARRLGDAGFWLKLRGGGVDVFASLRSLAGAMARTLRRPARRGEPARSLPEAVFAALGDFARPVLVVISERDLTAREFDDELRRRRRGGSFARAAPLALERVDADHTFSTSPAQAWLSGRTAEWLATLAKER